MSNPAAEIELEIRKRLRMCSLVAKGMWYVVREQIDTESSRHGYLQQGDLPLTFPQIARLADCVSEEASSPLQELMHAGLLAQERSSGAYHSSLLASLHAKRKRVYERVKRWKSKADTAARTVGVNNATGNAGGTPEVARAAPSPSPSPPHTPPLTPTPPLSFPSETRDGDGVERAGADGAGNPDVPDRPAAEPLGSDPPARRRRASRPRVLTDEQQRIRIAFSDWWTSAAWPRFHGGETYGFESVDGAAVLRILRHPKVKWDEAKARQVAEFYLTVPELYGVQGHPLRILAQRVNYYFGKLAQRRQEGSGHVLQSDRTSDSRGASRGGAAGPRPIDPRGAGSAGVVVDDYAIPVFRGPSRNADGARQPDSVGERAGARAAG